MWEITNDKSASIRQPHWHPHLDVKRPTHRLGGPCHKDGSPTTRSSGFPPRNAPNNIRRPWGVLVTDLASFLEQDFGPASTESVLAHTITVIRPSGIILWPVKMSSDVEFVCRRPKSRGPSTRSIWAAACVHQGTGPPTLSPRSKQMLILHTERRSPR